MSAVDFSGLKGISSACTRTPVIRITCTGSRVTGIVMGWGRQQIYLRLYPDVSCQNDQDVLPLIHCQQTYAGCEHHGDVHTASQ